MGTYASSSSFSTPDYVLILPCFNAASSIRPFLDELETTLKSLNRHFHIVVVDDASQDETAAMVHDYCVNAEKIGLDLLTLPRRHGQEGAIAEGLAFAEKINCERFIVMEANGRDDPRAITELIKVKQQDVVLVDKGPRAGNLFFWLIYRCFQALFRFLTSREFHFGYYSMINRKALQELNRLPFFHYATALCKSSLKKEKIRYEHKTGRLRKEVRKLFQQGIRSFLEFGEELLNAFLKLSLSLGFLLFAAGLTTLYFACFSETDLPGWTVFVLIGLFNALVLSIGVFAIGVMLLNRVRSPQAADASADQAGTAPRPYRRESAIFEPISLN